MLRFIDFLAESNWMYHGTPQDFGGRFKVDPAEHMIDRAIGVHFAADVTVSNKFAHGLYRGMDNVSDKPTGQGVVYRVKAPTGSKLLIVPQKTYHFPKYSTKEGDQGAIGGFIAATVFEERPDLFASWLARSRNITTDQAMIVYNAVKSGKMPPRDALGEKDAHDQSVRSIVKNFDSCVYMLEPDKRLELVKAFDAIMQARGIDALVYYNTSPMETTVDDRGDVKVRSTKTYVLLTHAIDRYPVEIVPATKLTTDTA